MKRRTLLAGIGALASGSGAVATSAAIANSVQTTSQLSVVVDERLEVRAGQAFNDDGTVKPSYTDRYVPYENNSSFFNDSSGGLVDIDQSDVPVATVNRRDNNQNQDVEIQTAISIENDLDTPIFEDILEIENYGGTEYEIGISYDRDDSQYDPNGQYGSDVVVGGDYTTELTEADVQSVYRFLGPDDTQISPDWFTVTDDPNSYITLGSGETKQLHLQIDLTTYGENVRSPSNDPKEDISNAADTTPTFQGTSDTVDMLDAITVTKKSDSG
jgi:hypothetical protein